MTANPSIKSAAFDALTPALFKVDALAGGTDMMRAAGTTLLPKHPEEADDNYNKRLSTSTLVGYYAKALDAAIGRAFAKPMALQNVPGVLTPLMRDIDGEGSTLEQFAQEALWNTIHHGSTFIVADYPTIEVQPQTLADANELAARPYLLAVTAPEVLAAYSRIDNGQEQLQHFRWLTSELTPSADRLTEEVVYVIKAYDQPTARDPITLRTWKSHAAGWIEQEPVIIQGPTSIPVVCAYGWRTGFFTGKPVLSNLADLNVAHWQSLSEQTHILSVARVPFLHVSGNNLTTVTPQADGSSQVTPFKLSIHSAAITPENTEIKWVETAGASIKAGAENIAYLEAKMEQMGLVPTTSTPGDVTATATAINAAEASAQLKTLCASFGQTLSKALYHLSIFAGAPAPTITASLDASFVVDEPTPEEVTADAETDLETA